jgi:hypothetical protein
MGHQAPGSLKKEQPSSPLRAAGLSNGVKRIEDAREGSDRFDQRAAQQNG